MGVFRVRKRVDVNVMGHSMGIGEGLGLGFCCSPSHLVLDSHRLTVTERHASASSASSSPPCKHFITQKQKSGTAVGVGSVQSSFELISVFGLGLILNRIGYYSEVIQFFLILGVFQEKNQETHFNDFFKLKIVGSQNLVIFDTLPIQVGMYLPIIKSAIYLALTSLVLDN